MWKRKEDGNLVVDDNGNPIWVDEISNVEKNVDYKETRKQIAELTEKAHNRKDAYDKIVSILGENGLTADNLPDFIKTSKVNQDKIDGLGKGGVNDQLKPLQDQIDALRSAYEKEKQEKLNLIEKQNLERISARFLESPYLKEKSDPYLCRDVFKGNFKVKDGEIVGYLDGKIIQNDDMENADFEYCIKKMIEAYPSKDKLLVGGISGGAGATGNFMMQSTNYDEMSFSELCFAIDSTNDPVLKETLKKKLQQKK